MHNKHLILFEPVKICSVEINNRFAMAPMGPAGMSDYKGVFNQRGVDFYVERAKGGAGLIITGTMTIENEIERRDPHMPYPTLNPKEFIRAARIMNERVHAYGTKIFAQLTAGFGRALKPFMLEENAELVSSSMNPNKWIPEMMTREITAKEIKSIVKAFGANARICQMCGFDGVQIHAVHEGYLLDQFTMPLFNRRTDKYGGSLENRIRFAREIVEEIKSVCGADFPVIVRYSPKHFIKGLRKGALPDEQFEEKGRDLYDEGIEMAKLLEKSGYDAFDVDVGSYDSWYWSHPPMYHEDGMYLKYSEELKKHLSTPIITAGRMDDPDFASSAISSGKTDMIGLARPLLADPYLPRKIKEDKLEDIRPCLSCHEGCLKRMHTLLSCAVNPGAGRESELKIERVLQQKKVVVAGGGIAGCEAARVCALRGHAVTVYEKNTALGGNIIPGGAPPFKANDRKLIKWYEGQLNKLGVKLLLNTSATSDAIKEEAPDTLIIATGSTPKTLKIPGSENKNVITASDALLGKAEMAGDILIIGGGLVGCETALWLAKKGKKVTIIEALEDILYTGETVYIGPNEQMLRDLLEFYKVEIITNATVKEVTGGDAVICAAEGERTVRAETIILAIGYEPDDALYNELKNTSYETYLLGDCKGVKNIMSAIWDSNEVARFI